MGCKHRAVFVPYKSPVSSETFWIHSHQHGRLYSCFVGVVNAAFHECRRFVVFTARCVICLDVCTCGHLSQLM